MPIDPQWNAIHHQRAWGKYPDEHLVRFFAHRFGLLEEGEVGRASRWPRPHVLDLGCGAGAQSLFLARESCVVVAVDGSPKAVERLNSRAELAGIDHLINAFSMDLQDFRWGFPEQLDLVVDVCTLQHMPLADACQVIARAREWMKPDGVFFSIMANKQYVTAENGDAPQFRTVDAGEVRYLFKDWLSTIGIATRTDPRRQEIVSHFIIEATPV